MGGRGGGEPQALQVETSSSSFFFFISFNVYTYYGDIKTYVNILNVVDNDKIVNSPTALKFTTCIHAYTHENEKLVFQVEIHIHCSCVGDDVNETEK